MEYRGIYCDICCGVGESSFNEPAYDSGYQVETEDPINPDVAAALVRGEAALQQFAVGSERRQAARSAARIVGALTQDASVASGVLLHEALDPASLDASAVAQEFGASAVAIARELRRLGEFGGGAQWSTTQPLPPGQAETLRKMLLAIVSDWCD